MDKERTETRDHDSPTKQVEPKARRRAKKQGTRHTGTDRRQTKTETHSLNATQEQRRTNQ
eukprot:scaffold301_cov142-Isochrysis_galbana.AAC.4